MRRRALHLLVCLGTVGLLATPNTVFAYDSVEGASLGDQTPYFNFGGTVFYFPQVLSNVDNRVTLQLGGAPAGYMNLRPEQRSDGVGLSIEPLDGMHFGFWVSEYESSLASSFLNGGVTSTPFGGLTLDGVIGTVPGWGPTAQGDLVLVDAANVAAGTDQDASRKADLFFALELDETLMLGARLWFGSQTYSVAPDDSIGPIDIDRDSQAGTGNAVGAEDSQVVGEGSFGNNDFGLALGATFAGIPSLTLDGALELNFIGIDQSPNGNDFFSAGGLGFGVNLRGMFDFTESWKIGGFARYARTSLSFEPTTRLDGGNLFPADQNPDADTAGSLPTPNRGAPPGPDPDDDGVQNADPGTTFVPVQGTQYSASQSELQIAAAGEWHPNSLATLYGSVGLRWDGYGDELAVGSFWSDAQDVNFFTRFMNIGVAGHVFSWMDLRIGTSRRWTSATTSVTSQDDRIPDNNDAQGPAGTPVADGNEENTNANRRLVETKTKVDLSNLAAQTRLSVGALIHYRGLQISGELNQGFLTDGLNFISGATNPLYVWVNFVYDWDYEQDAQVGRGDGTRVPNPHTAMGALRDVAASEPEAASEAQPGPEEAIPPPAPDGADTAEDENPFSDDDQE